MGSIHLITPEIKRLEARRDDALVVFRFAEMRPLVGITGRIDWRLLGRLSDLVIDGFLTGEPDERLLFPLGGRLPQAYLLMLGLGSRDELDEGAYRAALERMFAAMDGLGVESAALALPGRPEGATDTAAAIDGFIAAYDEIGGGRELAVIDSPGAHKAMLPTIERWRLKKSVPPDA